MHHPGRSARGSAARDTSHMAEYGRDPIHELEMYRAILSEEERRGASEIVLQGLRREIEWWTERAVRVSGSS